MSIKLLTKILLRRLNHFGYGEEKLWSDDGDNQSYKWYKDTDRRTSRGTATMTCIEEHGNNAHNGNQHAYADEYIPECFKYLSRAIEPLKKQLDFIHNADVLMVLSQI